MNTYARLAGDIFLVYAAKVKRIVFLSRPEDIGRSCKTCISHKQNQLSVVKEVIMRKLCVFALVSVLMMVAVFSVNAAIVDSVSGYGSLHYAW